MSEEKKIKTKYKHIFFEEEDNNPKRKTSVWVIMNYKEEYLGSIYWHNPWRQYCSFIEVSGYEKVILSRSCHREIANFIEQLMEARKQ